MRRARAPTLGIAVLGTGAAARMHAKHLARWFPEIRRYVASRSGERAQELARAVRAAAHFGSYEDALAHTDVETVLVTTPPASHLQLTLRALRAGKHVIVEKPAFLRAADFDLVRRAAHHHGRGVLVAENYFYKPLLGRLRALVASGALGQIRFVQINAVKRQLVEGWRTDPASSGGGALFEGGVHWVSLMANLGLDLRQVRAHMPGSAPGFERSVVLVGDYAEGAVGVLSYSWEIPGALRGLRLSRIWGTAASVLFETNGLFVARTGRRPALWVPDPTDIAGYRAMLADFLGALREGRPARFTLEAARRDVALVERAYGAASDPPCSVPVIDEEMIA
jgi:predicted dehydrogenase